MRKLFVLSGCPGSGKTYWANKVKKEHFNTLIISSDQIRKELSGSQFCFDNEKKVWKEFYKRIEEAAKEETIDDLYVIADSTCLIDEFRLKFLTKCPGYDKYILVLFNVSPSICIARNDRREGKDKVDDLVIKTLIKSFKYPSEEVINKFDEFMVISK